MMKWIRYVYNWRNVIWKVKFVISYFFLVGVLELCVNLVGLFVFVFLWLVGVFCGFGLKRFGF